MSEVSLRETADRITACANDAAALAAIDALLSERPEPEARRLRIKIANLRLTLRKRDGHGGLGQTRTQVSPGVIRRHRCLPEPWTVILTRVGLDAPDGRPLHRYCVSDREHVAIRDEIRRRARTNLADSDRETGALFVLWAAQWFQRDYRGGVRRWDDLGAALGVQLDGTAARHLTRQGLSAWRRPPQKSEAALHQWLMTLAVEGGFPAGVLEQAEAWAARYLARVVGALLSADPLDEDVALAAARSQADHAPRVYRQEIFFALAADLGATIVKLRRNVETDVRAQGIPASAWLDATQPGWREALPVRAGSEAAARLVDGLLLAEALQTAGDGRIGCERVLLRRDGKWRPALRLSLDGVAYGAVCQAIDGRRERMRAYPTGPFARYTAGELAIFEPPTDPNDGWRVRPSRRETLLNDVPFIAPVCIELRIDGRPIATTAWPGGEAVRGCLAIFAPEGGTDSVLTLIGEGSGQYRPEPLVVAAPPSWTISPHGEASTRDALPEPAEDGRRLWHVTGTVILRSPEGDAYRVAAGQGGIRRDRLALSGSEPKGLVSAEPEVELFAGLPAVRVHEGQTARAARPEEIRWRPEGERGWRRAPFGTGRIVIAWRDPETGFIRDRRRVALLPAGAQLACRRQGAVAVYTPEGFSASALASSDAELVLEWRGGDVTARFTGRPSRCAAFELTLGDSRPLSVSAPFPLEAGIARWSGTCIRGGPRQSVAARLSLAELADCVAFGRGVSTLHAALLDRDRRPLRGGAARWTFDGELPLRGVADDLAALLRPFADIDVVADLTFDDGAEHWQVVQFETALVLCGGRLAHVSGWLGDADLPVAGRAIDDLTVEVALGTSTAADRINQRTPVLPEELAGTWLLYLRRGDAVIARPSIAYFGPRRSTEAVGLAAAVTIADSELRQARLQNRLAQVAEGAPGTHADVRWLATLVAGLNGLPPASLDVLRLLALCPGAAARLLLHVGDAERPAVLALANALPFAWAIVSYTDWQRAAATWEAELISQFGAIAGAASLAQAVVRHTAEQLVRAEPLLGWPLCAAGLVAPPATHGPNLIEAARDHIRRHGDRVSENGPCGSMFRAVDAGELPREFLEAFHPVHLETLDAPCAAARAAAGRGQLGDAAVRRIKTAARADPLYFSAAFDAHFMRLARSSKH
ncbi:STY4851/ECs_5259 family protein [Methylobacterium komagatae]